MINSLNINLIFLKQFNDLIWFKGHFKSHHKIWFQLNLYNHFEN